MTFFTYICLQCGAKLPHNLECEHCGTRHGFNEEVYRPPKNIRASMTSTSVGETDEEIEAWRKWVDSNLIRLPPGFPGKTD